MAETYYDVLGVSPDASPEEIQSAYREQVKATHPDVSDDPDAGDRFKRVVRAEEVLGDESEREQYDRLGHEAYIRRVQGQNAAGAEQSPWTTSSRSDSADRTDTDGRSRGRTTANEDDEWGRGSEWGESSRNGGSADERTAERGETRSQSQRRQEFYRERTGGESEGYAVHDWDDNVVTEDRVSVPLTQERVLFLVVMIFLYPVLVFSSVTPVFPLIVKLVVGICTLIVTGYLVTVPPIGTTVFGVWSVLAPLALLVLPIDFLSLAGLFALGVCWIPFGYSLAVATVLRR
ncbi:J domain-containing protein [Halostella pelagica]|uniref:J domain-containing protein n=1 Tax=Halostella pelagica TaxID=2583824 RepID=UPI0010821338|nr:DnaJ domain-containing protein [Halostella pelagica]